MLVFNETCDQVEYFLLQRHRVLDSLMAIELELQTLITSAAKEKKAVLRTGQAMNGFDNELAYYQFVACCSNALPSKNAQFLAPRPVHSEWKAGADVLSGYEGYLLEPGAGGLFISDHK